MHYWRCEHCAHWHGSNHTIAYPGGEVRRCATGLLRFPFSEADPVCFQPAEDEEEKEPEG